MAVRRPAAADRRTDWNEGPWGPRGHSPEVAFSALVAATCSPLRVRRRRRFRLLFWPDFSPLPSVETARSARPPWPPRPPRSPLRSEGHTSELQSLMRLSYAVFCLQKNTNNIREFPIEDTRT